MANKVTSSKVLRRIYKKSLVDRTKAIDYLREQRQYNSEMLESSKDIGYIEHISIDKSFYIKNAIIIPLFDARDKLRGLNVRKLHEKNFLRLLCDDYPLFLSDYSFIEKTLVLVESPLCAYTIKPYLPDFCVSALITTDMSTQLLTLLKQAKKIILILDNDTAGENASNLVQESVENAYAMPLHIYQGFKDPNELWTETKNIDRLIEYVNKLENRT